MNRRSFFGAMAQSAAGIWLAPQILVPKSGDHFSWRPPNLGNPAFAYAVMERDGRLHYEMSNPAGEMSGRPPMPITEREFYRVSARQWGFIDMRTARPGSYIRVLGSKPTRDLVSAYFVPLQTVEPRWYGHRKWPMDKDCPVIVYQPDKFTIDFKTGKAWERATNGNQPPSEFEL